MPEKPYANRIKALADSWDSDVEIMHDLEALSTIHAPMSGMPLKLEINKTELFVLEILRVQAPNRDLLRPATLKSEERLELLRASHSHAEDPPELLVRPSQNRDEGDL